MTRKDYILIAEALRVVYYNYKLETPQGISRGLGAVFASAREIADSLARQNPRFDREHFLSVVRGEKELNSRPARR